MNREEQVKKVLEKNYIRLTKKTESVTFDMQFNTTDIFIVSPIQRSLSDKLSLDVFQKCVGLGNRKGKKIFLW